MANPVEGVPVAFVVQGLNRKGKPVPVSGVGVTSSDASDVLTVNADGTGGSAVFGSAGSRTVTASDDKGHTVSMAVVVDADMAVDTISFVFA